MFAVSYQGATTCGTASNGTTSHYQGASVAYSQPVAVLPLGDNTAARHTTADRTVGLTGHQEVRQICQDLSGLTNSAMSVMKQADGTLVIQTNPAPQPRPQLVHGLREIQRVNLVPAEQMVPRAGGADDDDDDNAQYVDIVVEDCDEEFEREECVS